MTSIEDLVSLFAGVPVADGNRWVVTTIVPRRLHLSRDAGGEFAIFLEGSSESFGAIPPWAGVAHSSAVLALPGEHFIAALRIVSQDPTYGNRVIAHIAYEIGRRLELEPDISNDAIVASVSWILPLLGAQEGVLGVERQFGLVGECVLLLRLLNTAARHGMAGREALKRWKGSGVSKRDFAAKGIAIEVKNTGHATRLHHFGSIEQLDPQSLDEEVFLFSLGMRRDASAPKKLPDYLAEVERGLVTASGTRDDEAVAMFNEQLSRYGYNPAYEGIYRAQSGFSPPHLPPTLFRERDLDRVRITSFKNDRLPTMVVGVGYELEVHGPGLAADAADAVLTRLMLATCLESPGKAKKHLPGSGSRTE